MKIIKLTEKIEAALVEHRQLFTDSVYRIVRTGRCRMTRSAFESAVSLGVSRGSIRRIDGGIVLEVCDGRGRGMLDPSVYPDD